MRAERAKTTYPNTPESDLQERVLHDVYLSNGLVTRVMATDPIDAIKLVNKAIDNHDTMVLA
jgi:hypothetical protein